MARKSTSTRKTKPSVHVRDIRSRKDPKGGVSDIFAKIGDIKGESLDAKHKDLIQLTSPIQLDSTISVAQPISHRRHRRHG